jgi:tetratricopeptide (TPR) repeat protein
VTAPEIAPETISGSQNQRRAAIERYLQIKEDQKLRVERGRTFRAGDPRDLGKTAAQESRDSVVGTETADLAAEILHRSSFSALPILKKPEPPKPSLIAQVIQVIGDKPLIFLCCGCAVIGLLIYIPFNTRHQSSDDTNRGHELLAKGDLKGAKQELDKAILANSEKLEAYIERAKYFAKTNRPADSIADLSKVLEISPNNSLALALRAQIELANGFFRNAIADYEKLAILKGSLSATDHASLGEAYLKDGQYSNALYQLNKSLESSSTDPQTLLNRAKSYNALGQLHAAIDDCNKIIETEKKPYEALIFKAGCEDELFQHKQALEDVRRAIELCPARPEAYLYRGSIFAKAKNFTAANRDFAIASKLNGSKNEAAYQKAAAFALQGNQAQAIHQFSLLTDDHSFKATPDFYIQRSNIYFLTKDYEHAIADLQNAQSLDQGYKTTCWLELAKCYAAKKDYVKAAAQVAHVLSDEPKSSLALVLHSQYSRLAGNEITALADLFKAIEVDPNNASAYLERGDYYRQHNQPDIALTDYKKALAIAPDFPQLKQKLAKLTTESKPNHDLKPEVVTAQTTQINSSDPQVLRAKGYKALLEGDNDFAVAAFSRAIRLNPNDPDLRLYLAHALIKTENIEQGIQQFYIWEKLVNPDAATEIGFVRLLPHQSDQAQGLVQDLLEHIAERNRSDCTILLSIARTCSKLGYKLVAASALDFASRVANDDELLEINRLRTALHVAPDQIKIKSE